MPIGNEILPNVYINNIEVYHNKINFSVMTVDSIENPVWSNKVYLKDAIKLKICCVVDNPDRALGITSGDIKINKVDLDTESFLLRELRKKEITSEGSYFENHRIYLKHYSVHSDNPIKDLTVFANVYTDMPNIEGPLASETIIANGAPVNNSIVLLKNGTQYYGAVHMHNNRYMENAYHSEQKHAFLQEVPIPNFKLKDLRSKSFKMKEYVNAEPTSTFSELFVSFDEQTSHNFMFFANIKEIIIKNTKFGGIIKSLDKFSFGNLLDDFKYRVFNIARHKIKSYVKTTTVSQTEKDLSRIIATKNIIRATQQGSEMSVIHGSKLHFISHTFDTDLHGIYFEDDLNDRFAGEYQYELEFVFKDPTIAVINSYITSLNRLISDAENYKNLLMRPGRYDHFLKTPEPIFEANLLTPSTVIEDLATNSNRLKNVIYNLSEEESREDLVRTCSLLNPKSCTAESVSVFIDEVKLLLNKFITVFDIEASFIKKNYEKKFVPKNKYSANTIRIKHRFKKVVVPSVAKTHYVYDTTTPEPKPPKTFGKRNNQMPFKVKNKNKPSNLKKFFTKSISLKKNKAPLFVSVFKNMIAEPKEKYTDASEYLGEGSNFNSFTVNEKCEPQREEPEIITEVQLSPTVDSFDQIENLTKNKMEMLSGFEMTPSGLIQLKKPIWVSIDSEMPQGTSIIKQIADSDRSPDIDFSFANQYILTNNTGIKPSSMLNYQVVGDSVLFGIPYTPMLTTNNITTNQPLPDNIASVGYNPTTGQAPTTLPSVSAGGGASMNMTSPQSMGGTSMNTSTTSTTGGGY